MNQSIGLVPVGEVVLLEWNHEPVQVVSQSFSRTIIRSLRAGGDKAEREASPGCEVLPYQGAELGHTCACGCGRVVTGGRKDRLYATSGCRIRVFRHKEPCNG